MSQVNTSSIEIVNTVPNPIVGETQTDVPFVFDTSYKGDEIKVHAGRIVGMTDPHGWYVAEAQDDMAILHYEDDADMSTHGHLRGTLVDLETDAIIADSFGHTPTAICSELVIVNNCIVVKDTEGVVHVFDMAHLLDPVVMKRVFEGVVLRALWRKGKFHLITHKRIDASRSKWGSYKYFLTMYEEAGGPTAEQLFDTSKPFSSTTYDFLVVDQGLLVGTRQRVNKPYIVCLAQRTIDPKRPADQVAPGRATFTRNERIGWSVNESLIHDPKGLTLAEANHHLKYGYYNPFETTDIRQSTGEAIIIYRMIDGVVSDVVKIHSPGYDWRVTLRGGNANINHQFYCLLNTVYGDVNTPAAWEAFKKRYIMFPLYDEQSLKDLYAGSGSLLSIPVSEVSQDDYSTRDARIHLLWINYVLSLPPHAQGEALNILSQFKKDRSDVTAWLQELESKTPNIESAEVSDRVKGLISSSRRLARERIAKGDNYAQNGSFIKLPTLIKNTLRNLINKENGPSLYGLVRVMKEGREALETSQEKTTVQEENA